MTSNNPMLGSALSSQKSEEVRVPARAKYDFVAQNDKEYTMKKGQSVIVIQQVDENWCIVESVSGEKSGRVPTGFVQVISSTPLKPRKNGQAIAKFDYTASTEKEISCKKGDQILLLEKIDDNWYKGKVGGKAGIIAAVYIDVESEPEKEERKEIPISFSKPEPSSQNASSQSANPDDDDDGPNEKERKQRAAFLVNSVVGSTYTLKNKERPAHFEDLIESVEKEGLPRLDKKDLTPSPTKVSQPVITNGIVSNENTSAKPSRRYVVRYAYEAGNVDELNLVKGDYVSVVETCEDGWFVGTCERSGAFGTFPGNYAVLDEDL